MKYGIIAVGYNRVNEMRRLLNSVLSADIGDIKADLIISLDYSDKQSELAKLAEGLTWKYGIVTVRKYSERQGLRKHILQCGDLTSQYDAVVVLEDDLVVSKGFMQYVDATVKQYNHEDKVAGISLYTHRTNPGNGRFFEAQFCGYDVFLMQYAQSWGQCWTREMWKGFREWYNTQSGELIPDDNFPDYIVNWNKESWLKYYMKYTVETGKYHIYPYHSLTTNCSAVGVHNDSDSSAFQVPLQYGVVDEYRLPPIDCAVKYDVFFEREFPDSYFPSQFGKVVLDLYGLRKRFDDADTLISTNLLPYKVIKRIGLNYRPIEQNIINGDEGEGIFFYDLKVKGKRPKGYSILALAKYEFKAQSGKMTFAYTIQKIKRRFNKK